MSPAEFRRLVVQTLPVTEGDVAKAEALVLQVDALSNPIYARRWDFVTRVVADWSEGAKHITGEGRKDRAVARFYWLLETAYDGWRQAYCLSRNFRILSVLTEY